MPTLPDFGFCGPTYQAVSSVLDAERSINLYPEPAPGSAKGKMALIGTPGVNALGTMAFSPIRGLWGGNNRLFAVAGRRCYEVNPVTGAVIHDHGYLPGATGAIVGYQAQFYANGTQLLVYDPANSQAVNVISGGATAKVFDAHALEYLDGFYVAIATGASLAGTNPNQINVSAYQDGTSWNALDYVIRTSSADLTLGLAANNGLLWVFGQKTIDIWYNAGNPNFPFARMQGAPINVGCLAPETICKLDNSLFWLGADDRGYGTVYRSSGYQPVRVSNYAIEQLIGMSGVSGSFGANAFAYQEAGHLFYVLNLPFANLPLGGSTSTGATLVYDVTTQLWHERYWYNTGTSGMETARPYCFASVYTGSNTMVNLAGDRATGDIYSFGLSQSGDFGGAIKRIRTAPHISNSNRWLKYRSFELDADIGTAAPVLDYSNDGGRTWASYTRTLTGSAALEFKRYKAWQLGRSRDRVFRVTITDSANPIRLVNAYVGADAGTED